MPGDRKEDERVSFSLKHFQNKCVSIACDGFGSSGFYAKIATSYYIVLTAHGVDKGKSFSVYQGLNGNNITPQAAPYYHKTLDVALIPLTQDEVQGKEFFELRPLDLVEFVGRTVRQIGTRGRKAMTVTSGVFSVVDEDTGILEVDAHTEPGQSGSVNVVDEVVIGIHGGSRALKVAPLNDETLKNVLDMKVNEASVEQLNQVVTARLLHLAKYGGARAWTVSVNEIIKLHEALLIEPKVGISGPAPCAACGATKDLSAGNKFCSKCGAKF